MLTIRGARVYHPREGFVQREIALEGERFVPGGAGGRVLDAGGLLAIPGLIDLHFHGCVGADFSDGDPAAMAKMARYQARNGITAICPATVTLPEAALARACRQMAALGAPEGGAALVGINLEGPFLSPQKPGAQNPRHLHPPDLGLFQRLQTAAGGLVRLVSIAPEEPGAMELIAALEGKAVCSLAHTAAPYEVALEAFARGARHVTHLYNAMPPFGHRAPGVVGAALDSPQVMVELICDGVHLHPAVVRATFRLFGPERIVLVSDSMMAAGMGDGLYRLGDLEVAVAGKVARLAEGDAIAGSVTHLADCLRAAVGMGIPLAQAVGCATRNPARVLGLADRGDIAPGKVADLLLLEENTLEIRQVILRGRPL